MFPPPKLVRVRDRTTTIHSCSEGFGDINHKVSIDGGESAGEGSILIEIAISRRRDTRAAAPTSKGRRGLQASSNQSGSHLRQMLDHGAARDFFTHYASDFRPRGPSVLPHWTHSGKTTAIFDPNPLERCQQDGPEDRPERNIQLQRSQRHLSSFPRE